MSQHQQHPLRPNPRRRALRSLGVFTAVAALGATAGCGGDSPSAPVPTPPSALACDDGLKTAFAANATVLLVKSFKQGDALNLDGTTPAAAAGADLCLVKMVVGPGNPGTAGAPSTSSGIGIEVWLPTPTAWNERINNLGGGGWAGGDHTSTTLIGDVNAAATAAGGYVVGTTDTGHPGGGALAGSFAMREDGGINSTLWKDFADRGLEELAIETKALANLYYAKPAKYAYWQGCSTGGRQGYKMAQEHPEHYDGYIIDAPAINWTRFITNELYPQVVMQRDLNGALNGAQIGLASAASVSACDTVGTEHLGFIVDPRQCRYDPTRDANILCAGVAGNGVTGTSTDPACLNVGQAQAVNKIWYGQTADGTAPDPQVDNAGSATPSSSNHLWWGLSRGSFLGLLAGDAVSPPFLGPFPIASDMVALELQDPSYATPSFTNATGNGQNRWTQLSYAELASAYSQGISLQSFFGNINTDNPDLAKAKARGAKIIHLHGWGDQLIPAMGSINYYTRLSNLAGGFAEAQSFNRLYMIPALGHCSGVGSVSGTAGPAADANRVPLAAPGQFFDLLVDWVEKGNAPDRVVLQSADASVTMPVCPYPKKATYAGAGSITAQASYSCQ